ncbi:hypothetical protein [Klenkia sp. PcliD-1-E]|uniref:hypothetical protein n=1 Tax=Klenkia sp. PcliD-1-E TaxID=2954492 RepID=UPI002097EA38|nr:hypothetical protein [Klenkia sp. PcliD-1-E]MCO7221261.1 hypothetical protein [Klenkia sp. PcliD-1-E]
MPELLVWLVEDVRVNRARGGGLSVVAVLTFRLHQFGCRAAGPAARLMKVAALPGVLVARLLLGCEIPGSIACGRRLVLAHGGRGVVVVEGVEIGDDVVMAPFAAIGTAYPAPGVPTIEDGVYLGTHATVLGQVTIGAGAFLGARALVLSDVPPGGFAAGVPAEIRTSAAG